MAWCWGPSSDLADLVLGLWELAWVSVSPILPNTKLLCQHHLHALLCRLAREGGMGGGTQNRTESAGRGPLLACAGVA